MNDFSFFNHNSTIFSYVFHMTSDKSSGIFHDFHHLTDVEALHLADALAAWWRGQESPMEITHDMVINIYIYYK